MSGSIIPHKTFGDMEQDGSDYRGRVAVGSHESVSITVFSSDGAGTSSLDDAAKLLARIDPDALISTAVEAYLDTYNDSWSSEGEDIDEEEFRSRLTLSSITFKDDQTAAVYIDCDDMFQGHAIRIELGSDGSPEGTSLAG